MYETILLQAHKLKKKISKKIQQKKEVIKFVVDLKIPKGEKVYILGSPLYENLGDSAIFLAQFLFLKKNGIAENKIKEITFDEYNMNRKVLRKLINKKHLLCGMGGGNMGNQWIKEEQFRYDMMKDFPKNPVVIFPQTIHFLDGEKRIEEENKSISVYDNKERLTLIAREEISYGIMKYMYQQTDILLIPDIVLSMNMQDFGVKPENREGVLLCVRKDEEKSIDEHVWKSIENELKLYNIECQKTDMYSNERVTKENRQELVKKKMQEFCKAELVITDRLHGMVFSAITETPCIIFSNYNHKIKGTYEWISHLGYIKYAESFEQAKEYIPELLKLKRCEYDNSCLNKYFEKIREIVKEECL